VTASMLLLTGMLNSESPSVVLGTVKMTWWDSLKAGWRLWPFAHIITYSLPRDHRYELFEQCCTCLRLLYLVILLCVILGHSCVCLIV
jgi:protein Mpv17